VEETRPTLAQLTLVEKVHFHTDCARRFSRKFFVSDFPFVANIASALRSLQLLLSPLVHLRHSNTHAQG
jgi:hypothetical protein